MKKLTGFLLLLLLCSFYSYAQKDSLFIQKFTLYGTTYRLELHEKGSYQATVIERYNIEDTVLLKKHFPLQQDKKQYEECIKIRLDNTNDKDKIKAIKDSCAKAAHNYDSVKTAAIDSAVKTIRKEFRIDRIIKSGAKSVNAYDQFLDHMLLALHELDPKSPSEKKELLPLLKPVEEVKNATLDEKLEQEKENKSISEENKKTDEANTRIKNENARYDSTKKEIDWLWKQIFKYTCDREVSNRITTEFAFYTDFVGIQDDRPNGLYQTELTFKFPLTKKYIIHNDGPTDFSLQTCRSFVAQLGFAHLENMSDNIGPGINEARSLQLMDSSIITHIDTAADDTFYKTINSVNAFDLVQWRNFNSRLKLNFLTIRTREHKLYFEVNAGAFRTSVFDTIANRRNGVTSATLGGGIFYESRFGGDNPQFNIRVNYVFNTVLMLNNDFKQVNGGINVFYPPSVDYQDYKIKNSALVHEFAGRISYQYNANKNKTSGLSNEIFMRVGILFSTPKVGETVYHNSNLQVQLGATFDLSNLLKSPKSPYEN